MRKRSKPKREIIEYQLPKAAAAGGGSSRGGGGSGGFKLGHNLECRVSHAEPGGYAVIITKYNIAALLPTEVSLRPGVDVIASFVCVSNGRVLLTSRFGNKNSDTISLSRTTDSDGEHVSSQE